MSFRQLRRHFTDVISYYSSYIFEFIEWWHVTLGAYVIKYYLQHMHDKGLYNVYCSTILPGLCVGCR